MNNAAIKVLTRSINGLNAALRNQNAQSERLNSLLRRENSVTAKRLSPQTSFRPSSEPSDAADPFNQDVQRHSESLRLMLAAHKKLDDARANLIGGSIINHHRNDN